MSVEPQTAREALFEIRRRVAAGDLNDGGQLAIDLDLIAEAGLSRTAPINFELSDQLADRLAEAHAELRRIKDDGFPNGPRDAGHIDGILALPPDLEAMVERRIGPHR